MLLPFSNCLAFHSHVTLNEPSPCSDLSVLAELRMNCARSLSLPSSLLAVTLYSFKRKLTDSKYSFQLFCLSLHADLLWNFARRENGDRCVLSILSSVFYISKPAGFPPVEWFMSLPRYGPSTSSKLLT